MAIDTINSKLLLKDWIKRRLGYPVIQLEFHDDQLESNIDDAVKMFTKYSGEATYRSALVLQLSGGIDEYPLDASVESVLSLSNEDAMGGGINTLFTIQNQMYNSGYIDIFSGTMNLASYHMAMEYLELSKIQLSAEYFTDFNVYTNTLKITPSPSEDMYGVLEVFTKRDFSGATSTIFDEIWVKKYALALSKEVLGNIWGKYEGMPLPGGGTLNASKMADQGEKEVEALEEKLIVDEGEPLEPSIG